MDENNINNSVANGFNKLFWGFLFIMIDFKFQGFDILPDIVGYVLFVVGLGILASNNDFFKKAEKFNIPMLILSVFSIYEKPVEGSGFQFGQFGLFGVIIGIVALILNLMLIYNLFLGIKEMAERQGKDDIYEDADKTWSQYVYFQIAVIIGFMTIFIPPIALAYFVVLFIFSIVLTGIIMRFMTRCGGSLNDKP